jgi:hypothetical protein
MNSLQEFKTKSALSCFELLLFDEGETRLPWVRSTVATVCCCDPQVGLKLVSGSVKLKQSRRELEWQAFTMTSRGETTDGMR